MSSAPDDGETYKPLVVKGAGVGNPSELKLKVEVRRDEIALVVKVDGMKLTAETCVTCPLGWSRSSVVRRSVRTSPAIAATDAVRAEESLTRSTSNAAATS